jgi:NTP pyrophosphatase (non-canonical NTP hydrolase)
MDYKKIENEIRKFVQDRDWDKFHSPKNLAMALSVEASELVEIFQWQEKDDYKLEKFEKKTLENTKKEVADIFYYLIRICDKMNIDLEEAFFEKMEQNKNKYPSEIFKGKSTKYNQL